MGSVKHIQPLEAYGYFVRNKERLSEELVEIASNQETNTSVYMTEEDGNPSLYVYRDDRKIFQSKCATIYETERNLRVIYATYMPDPEVVDAQKADATNTDDKKPEAEKVDSVEASIPKTNIDDMSNAEFENYCEEREDVILAAVTALIEVLTEGDSGVSELNKKDGIGIDSVINHIVEFLAIKAGLTIRRPMTLIDDDTNTVVRTEYPYDEYEFSETELH